MKLANTILFIILFIIALYVLFKLIVGDELNRADKILLILFLAGTFLQAAIRSKINKNKGENTQI
jgi:hypothetical protein